MEARSFGSIILALTAMAVLDAPAIAQQATGTPGPATTTVDGRYLPNPPTPFRGDIQTNAMQSKPAWPALVTPPEGAPNVLLIMTDDVGFSAPSTFGGVIPTPALDRIAAEGLRYTRFHTTALCSPTRAALLTGRNHHSASTGVVVDQATGFPGYDSVIKRDTVAVGEILRLNGYDTSWYGKDHNTPQWVTSQAGPFTDWPTGPVKGFDYFYGFIGDDTSQWQPNNLFRNTTPIQPYLGKPGWNLITAMADEAIQRIRMLNEVQPDRPFMIYYAPGATHAPHHPMPEWVRKISDMHLFDKGFEAVREQIFANQKKLGVIPPNAKLTEWPKELLKTWEQHSPEDQKLLIRQADVYAAYLAYADHEIGRVIQAVEDLGKRDNTLIIFISGDNGASAEGSAMGTWNEVIPFNGVSPSTAENMLFYDAWGNNQTYPHYSYAWAWTFDTPYKWTKQIASYFGGTKNGMVVSWPAKIKDTGSVRWQFHHVIDIVPTLLEVAGIPQPVQVDGVAQKPIEGVSLAYTFDKNAGGFDAPSRHHLQYFEMLGVFGLYNDGWILSAKPIRPPWELTGTAITDPATAYELELYNLAEDWTQYTDVAAKHPEKVREMRDLMFGEFAKYQVLPLDASAATRFITPRPSLAAGRTLFEYSGETITDIPEGNMPSLLNKSYTITAQIEVPANADGMIYNEGGRFFGYGLYLLKGKPVFLYNNQGIQRTRWEGPVLAPGKHTIEFDFRYDGLGEGTLAYNNVSGVGRGGTGTLKVDGKVVSTQKMEFTVPLTKPLDTVVNIGIAAGTPVDDKDYAIPFKFNGKLEKLTIVLDPPKLSPEDIKKLKEAEARQAADK